MITDKNRVDHLKDQQYLLDLIEREAKSNKVSGWAWRIIEAMSQPAKGPRRSKRAEAFERRYVSTAERAVHWSVSTSAIYHSNSAINGLNVFGWDGRFGFFEVRVEALEKHREEQTRTR